MLKYIKSICLCQSSYHVYGTTVNYHAICEKKLTILVYILTPGGYTNRTCKSGTKYILKHVPKYIKSLWVY